MNRVPEAVVNNARTNLIAAVSHALHRHLLWFLLAAYVVAAVWPGPGLWLKDVTFGEVVLFGQRTPVTLPMLLLALMLLNAGLGAHISRPRELLQTSRFVAAGLAANFLVPLALIVVVAQLLSGWSEPDETQALLVGLAIVAAMPVAGSSTAWSQNYNGNLTLSLGLVLVSTLLSPMSTPLSLHAVSWMLGEDSTNELSRLAAIGSSGFLIIFVALPSALGICVRGGVGGRRVDRIKPYLKLSNSLTLLALNYINGAISLPEVVRYPDWDFLAVTVGITVGFCVTTFCCGWWLSRLLGGDRSSRTALMFGLGMSNNGSGLVLAATALAGHPQVMLPILFYNLVQHLVAGSAAYLINDGRARPEAREMDSPARVTGIKGQRSRPELKPHNSYLGSAGPSAPD
jgi:BASS family bile acid:Na+ symporter